MTQVLALHVVKCALMLCADFSEVNSVYSDHNKGLINVRQPASVIFPHGKEAQKERECGWTMVGLTPGTDDEVITDWLSSFLFIYFFIFSFTLTALDNGTAHKRKS